MNIGIAIGIPFNQRNNLIAFDFFKRTDGAVGKLDSGQLWSIVSGTWSITSNKLTSTGAGLIRIGSLSMSDFKVDASILNGNTSEGLAFCIQDNNNYYYAEFGSSLKLFKKVGGTFTQIASDSMPLTSGLSYSVTVQKRGSILQLSIDDQLKINLTDSTYNIGTIGFACLNSAVFNNINVRD